jgi:hypothetical protein
MTWHVELIVNVNRKELLLDVEARLNVIQKLPGVDIFSIAFDNLDTARIIWTSRP